MKKRLCLIISVAFVSMFILSCEKEQPKVEKGNITISPTTLSLSSNGGEYIVNVTADNDWEISSGNNVEWISLDPLSGSAGENIPVVIVVSENTSDSVRSANFIFNCRNTEVTLMIHQEFSGSNVIELPEATHPNTFIINEEEHQFGSSVSFMVDENPSVAASVSAGNSSWEQIFASDQYFFAAVSPTLVNKRFDIMTEPALYTIISQLSGAILDAVSPAYLSEVSMGECIYEIVDENSVSFRASLMLADGTLMAVNISASNYVESNENIISRGDEIKPIRSSFYMEEDGLTAIYLTPAELYYFDELPIASWYMYIMVDDNLLTGDIIELSSVEELVMIGMEDNLNPDNSWMISSEDFDGAGGNLSFFKNSEGNYTVTMNVDYQGVSYSVEFSGESIPYDYIPQEPDNYFKFGSDNFAIVSSSYFLDETIVNLTLTLENDLDVIVTFPEEFIDGNAHGFSQSEYFTVTYKDIILSKATGYSGTMTALYKDNGEFHIEFTNYDDCEFYYTGMFE